MWGITLAACFANQQSSYSQNESMFIIANKEFRFFRFILNTVSDLKICAPN